jgi:TolA-binding protein
VLELNKALAEENGALRARTEELRALLDESHSKVEKLSGLQREQLDGLQKKLQEQVRCRDGGLMHGSSSVGSLDGRVHWATVLAGVGRGRLKSCLAIVAACYVLNSARLQDSGMCSQSCQCLAGSDSGDSHIHPCCMLRCCLQGEWVAKSQELNKHIGTLIEENKLLQAKADAAEQQAQSLERLNQVYKETMEATIQKAEAGLTTAAGQKKVRTHCRKCSS